METKTMGNDKLDFESLEGDFDAIETKESTGQFAKTEKYPCDACGGTGQYKGMRVHQHKAHCFVCKGKGFFLTSPSDRKKARLSAQKRKEKKAVGNWKDWEHDNPELAKFLINTGHFATDFRISLIKAVHKYGGLTDGQHQAAIKLMAKAAESTQQRQEEAKKRTSTDTFDLSKVHELFEQAMDSGIKKPRLSIKPIVLSRAPDHGRNAGCIYVKLSGEYQGKITPEGKLMVIRDAMSNMETIETELKNLVKSPGDYAKAYGKRTGNCCCCGRELTDPKSIEAGIGPICETNWGL